MKTAFESSRLAIAGYIVPYLFFFNDGILLYGGFLNIILCIAIALIGVLFVVIALGGWMLTRVTWPERCILLVLAIIIPFPVIPNIQSLILGLVVFGILYLVQKNRLRKQALPV